MNEAIKITNLELLSYLNDLLGFEVKVTDNNKFVVSNEEFDIQFIFPFLEPAKQVLDRHFKLIIKMLDEKGLIAKSIFKNQLLFYFDQMLNEEVKSSKSRKKEYKLFSGVFQQAKESNQPIYFFHGHGQQGEEINPYEAQRKTKGSTKTKNIKSKNTISSEDDLKKIEGIGPKFELYQSEKNEKYYFRLVAANNQIILKSQGYKSKEAAQNGILSVQENSTVESRYERKVATNGKPYFSLKATNGQIVGDSQMYASNATMENGIRSVTEHAPIASIVDLSE